MSARRPCAVCGDAGTREEVEAASAAERSRAAREALERHLAGQDIDDDDGLGCARAVIRYGLGTLVGLALLVALVRWL